MGGTPSGGAPLGGTPSGGAPLGGIPSGGAPLGDHRVGLAESPENAEERRGGASVSAL